MSDTCRGTPGPWAQYLQNMPLIDRVLVAHENPNNFKLIDRAAEKARMAVRMAVDIEMARADDEVDRILGGGRREVWSAPP
jgi:hypothetical protein